MDTIFTDLLPKILTGGPAGIFAILLLIIVILLWHIRTLTQTIEKKDEKIDKIIDQYHSGNLSISEAMNSLKLVLAEIRGRLL